jgi:hypothetical protein
LWEKVERGRQLVNGDVTEAVAYFEWSAPEDADPASEDTWRACMPALGHTVTPAAVRADFLSMGINEFRRAYLNQWTLATTDPVIPLDRWAKVLDPEWVAGKVAELVDRWGPLAVVCDPAGPAGSLVPDLQKLGLDVRTPEGDKGLLELLSARNHAQACGLFFDRVMAEMPTLRHLDQPSLTTALAGAKKRPLGDAWAWSRTSSSVDISPLVAATLATWAFEQHREGDPEPAVWSMSELMEALGDEDDTPSPEPDPEASSSGSPSPQVA